MTKPVTAVATLILVERGLISLLDKVSEYLPEFKDIHVTQISESDSLIDLGKAQNEITICSLFTYTSEIGIEPLKYANLTDEDIKSLYTSVNFYSRIGLDFEPGIKQQYSEFGAFDVLVCLLVPFLLLSYKSLSVFLVYMF